MRLLTLSLLPLAALAQAPQGCLGTPRSPWPTTRWRSAWSSPARGDHLRAAILDGDQRIWSTRAAFSGRELTLDWNYFDSTLRATLDAGSLRGTYGRRTRSGVVSRAFTAVPFHAPAAEDDPRRADVSGVWRFQTDAARGAKTMDGRFRQSGAEVTGTIQRVDGDFGTLSGSIRGNMLKLSHFDGIRATLLEAELTPKGTLEGTLDRSTRFVAARLEQAAALGIPAPPDPSRYAAVKNPADPFSFRFMDLDGNWVSTEDARMRGKAMIVTVMGSWCPNCHDEARGTPASSTRSSTPRGSKSWPWASNTRASWSATVASCVPSASSIAPPTRCCSPAPPTTEKWPGNCPNWPVLAAFPTTFYLDREHKVRAVHAGFAGPANPEEHRKLKTEMRDLVREMLTPR